MRQCFKKVPGKFQSRPTFLAGFFSKRVTDDDDRRNTFFLASRGEDSSLIHRVVTMDMEYRSPLAIAHPIRQIFLGSIPNIVDPVYRLHTRAMGL